jgi:hypothetical protein
MIPLAFVVTINRSALLANRTLLDGVQDRHNREKNTAYEPPPHLCGVESKYYANAHDIWRLCDVPVCVVGTRGKPFLLVNAEVLRVLQDWFGISAWSATLASSNCTSPRALSIRGAIKKLDNALQTWKFLREAMAQHSHDCDETLTNAARGVVGRDDVRRVQIKCNSHTEDMILQPPAKRGRREGGLHHLHSFWRLCGAVYWCRSKSLRT